MEDRKIILQNSSSNNSNQRVHFSNMVKNNNNNQNKLPIKSSNSGNINYVYNNNKEKIHENIAKKYYSNKSLEEMNKDTKSNYSAQSNNSSQTIKSMVDLINTSGKSLDGFSFKEIKCRKYPIDSLNSSKMSQDAKYVSTNYSINHKELITQNTQFINVPHMNLVIKQKIENAKLNEEIILPNSEINLESLTINKPITIKGQQNSCLFINGGPILIDLENYNKGMNNNPKNFIKFSQMRILYDDSKVNKDKKITILFKLHPSTFLELEDCDIGFQPLSKTKSNKEKKSVAFLLSSNKTLENNKNKLDLNYPNTTILNLTNTRIHDFYQSIRSGQNCIANITKSAFLQNYGKAIVMINPISLKINESLFQNNMDNTVHVKYIEDNLFEEKRKIFINKNEFENTLGNHVCIEGIKSPKLDLSLVLTKNNFIKSNTDGVLAYDLLYNFFEVGNNTFKKNQGNGLYIQKSFYNKVFLSLNKNIQYQPIKIKDNQYIENKGFGLFNNDCIIEAISNKFKLNRHSGMFLCNISVDDPKQGFNGIQNFNSNNNNINYNLIDDDDFSTIIKEVKRSSNLLNNSFIENGENGLFVYGYPYYINIFENVFNRNCKNGISIDLDPLYKNNNNINNNLNNNNIININTKKRNQDFNTLLSEFKSCPNKSSTDLADITITNCVIENNKKTGIVLNSCLIYCDGSFIINNLDYAISIKKKEYQYCFKSGKKNVINGSIGGAWGQIDMGKEGCGFFCMGKDKLDLSKKEDILNKVPKSLDESSFEDYGGKHYSYDLNKGNKNQLNKSRPGNKSDNLGRSLAQSEKNKNVIKNIKNNQDDKDCCIF